MTTSLVTGGAGFIGSHVAKHCIDLGHKVVVLDDLSGGFRDHVPAEAIFVEGSITAPDLLSRLFEQYRFDYVYHLAAYAAEGLSHFIRRFNYTNNVIGSVNLINESVKHRVKCFVFTSSIAVYGAAQVPMSEDMIPQPEDPYGIAKYAVELDLRAAHHQFGLSYVIFRPHNVYGEHQNLGDRYRNVIGIFMNQIMGERPLTIFGDGKQTRAFSYIDDIAPYIAAAPHTPKAYSGVFNIGADTPFSVNELASVVARSLNMPLNVQHEPPRQEVMHVYADHSRVKALFGVKPTVTLEEGIGRMAKWASRSAIRPSKGFEGIEITEGLPPIWLA